MIGSLIVGLTKLLTGAQARWVGTGPIARQRIYFANHTSHLDSILIWAALPDPLRRETSPVAARDYWGNGTVKRYLATQVFRCVLIDRKRENPEDDPLEPLYAALDAGRSLIIFPEGTRGLEAIPAPFKSGLYWLARNRPNVEVVPVWLENLNRVMPKGEFFPVPLLSSVSFGAPLALAADEPKAGFLERARDAIVKLSRND